MWCLPAEPRFYPHPWSQNHWFTPAPTETGSPPMRGALAGDRGCLPTARAEERQLAAEAVAAKVNKKKAAVAAAVRAVAALVARRAAVATINKWAGAPRAAAVTAAAAQARAFSLWACAQQRKRTPSPVHGAQPLRLKGG